MPLQVLNEPGKAAQSKSYMWVLATTLAAINQVMSLLSEDATILGLNYDTGERYLFIDGFLSEES